MCKNFLDLSVSDRIIKRFDHHIRFEAPFKSSFRQEFRTESALGMFCRLQAVANAKNHQ